ncbi:MAG TPA: TRAP transporter small permease [Methylomirabilota bacterium]|jgi:TRAP-type C4-dicarboxylate transport system permease small subunit|nr:TRAP transporter small permease [Methylomirabilota bacterium]
MARLLIAIERGLLPLLAALLAFITLGIFVQVCLRYLFSVAFIWGEELSLFAFIWCVFLGAAVNTRRRSHFSFDFLAGLLRGRAAAAQRLLVDLIVLGFSIFMLVKGYEFAVLGLKRLSPGLGITMFVPTLIIPVSAAYMILAAAVDALRDGRQVALGTPESA